MILGVAIGASSGKTLAAFSSSTRNRDNSFSAKRIFSAERSWSFYDLRDAADGSESNESWVAGNVDANYYKTKNWPNSFNSGRYMDFSFNSPLPAGVAVASSSFDFTFADDPGGGGENSCYYFEVRKRSDSSLVSTHGSTSSPIGCEAGNTMQTVSTPVTAVTSSTLANDLFVRVFIKESAAKAARVDAARISGQMLGVPFTLYPRRFTDLADGATTTTTWGPAVAGDGSNYQVVGNWSSSLSASRYIRLDSPSSGYVPNGATVNSVTFTHSYRNVTAGDTVCWVLAAYDGETLIEVYGGATPIGCNSTTNFVTETVTLTGVDTAAEASNLNLRIYQSVTGNRKSQHDQFTLNVDYSMPAEGCVNPGSTTVATVGDSWIQEDNVTHTAGTDNILDLKSQATKARRALIQPGTLPTLATDCGLASATLRVYSSSAQGTRTLEAIMASASWDEAAVNWTNRPGTTGTASTAPNGVGWIEFDVTAQIAAMYAGTPNYGFYVKDSNDNDASNFVQGLHSEENANKPELVITSQ
jgi:hypothetical protein